MNRKDKIILWCMEKLMEALSQEALEEFFMAVILSQTTVVDISNEGMQKLLDEIEDGSDEPKLLN